MKSVCYDGWLQYALCFNADDYKMELSASLAKNGVICFLASQVSHPHKHFLPLQLNNFNVFTRNKIPVCEIRQYRVRANSVYNARRSFQTAIIVGLHRPLQIFESRNREKGNLFTEFRLYYLVCGNDYNCVKSSGSGAKKAITGSADVFH